MNILDRFSSHLKDILARSIHVATELKNKAVDPIHLFFAVANQKGSVAAEIITRLKISAQSIEDALLNLPLKKETVLQTNGTAQQVLTPLSPATKTVLEKAMSVAQENNNRITAFIF